MPSPAPPLTRTHTYWEAVVHSVSSNGDGALHVSLPFSRVAISADPSGHSVTSICTPK